MKSTLAILAIAAIITLGGMWGSQSEPPASYALGAR
jgi:hypothetical protein